MQSDRSVSQNVPQIIAVSVKNVLLLVYGLTMGMPTILIPNLSGGVPGENIVLDEDGISWIGSLNLLSVPLGCLISGIITKRLGRIKSMQAISVLFFGAFLLFYFASQPWQVFLGLFLNGFSGGLLEAPTLIYTVEITQPHLRGALSSTSTLAIVIGLMISFILGTIFPWRTVSIISCFIPLLGLISLNFIPESPYWLITKGNLGQAQKNIAWLRGWTDIKNVEDEFRCIIDELNNKEKEKKLVNWRSYANMTFIKPYMLIFLTFILAQFGTTQINTFAINIFQLLRVPIDSYYATILIGAAELLGSLLLILLVKQMGKRLLMFISQMGIFWGFLLVGIYTYNFGALDFDSNHNNLSQEVADRYSWVPLVAIISIAFFSYLMTYSLPWIIMGEMYSNDIRDTASGMSAATGYVIGFLGNKTFLNLVGIATLAGVFWFYSLVALVGVICMHFLLPETEGKALVEITDHYAGRGKLSNRIGRKKVEEKGISNKAFNCEDISTKL